MARARPPATTSALESLALRRDGGPAGAVDRHPGRARSRLEAVRAATPVLWFQSGPLLKRMSLGFGNLLADVYWMRAVVYYGGRRQADAKQPQLRSAVSAAHVRDDAGSAVQGGLPLRRDLPDRGVSDRAGPAGSRDRAARDAASPPDPNAWEYMHDIGFVYYWWLHDYQGRGSGSTAPASCRARPPGWRRWRPTTLAEGGDRQSSRFLWRQLHGDQRRRTGFARNARAAPRAARCDGHDRPAEPAVADASWRASGRPPQTLAELVAGERLRGVPLDPTGDAVRPRCHDRAASTCRRSPRSGRCRPTAASTALRPSSRAPK